MVIPLFVYGEHHGLSPKTLKYSCPLKAKGAKPPNYGNDQPSMGTN